jgi:hypothetical protein
MDTVGQQFVKDSILPSITYKQNQYNDKLKEYADTVTNLCPGTGIDPERDPGPAD